MKQDESRSLTGKIGRLHHIRRTQDWAARTRQDWIGNTLNLVVTTPRGQGAYNAQIAADLKRRVDRLGLPPVTPHSFRRTAVSILLSQGVDIATCMKVMGWKNAKVPLEIYAQLTEDGFDQVRNVFKGLAA